MGLLRSDQARHLYLFNIEVTINAGEQNVYRAMIRGSNSLLIV